MCSQRENSIPMSSSLDIEHSRTSVDAARRCRDLADGLLAGKDRWAELGELVGVLEGLIRLSSPECPVTYWQVAVALACALDCDHRLREGARTHSSGVVEESTRLVVLLRDLDELLGSECGKSLRGRSGDDNHIGSAQLDVNAVLELLSGLPLPTLYYAERKDEWRGRKKASEEQSETKPPLLKVIAFLDNSPLVCPQVLRPALLYSLRFRVRGSYWPQGANSLHLDLNYSRSWFQTPNTYDNLNAGGVNLAGVAVTGPTDQRSKIGTFDIAPSYTRVVSQTSVWNFGAYLRKDNYHYYPSGDPFADLGPVQQESIGQDRSLANAGLHSDISYVKGANNVRVGAQYEQTFLDESDVLGIVSPTYLDSLGCMSGGSPDVPVAAPCTTLYPYDLTRGGTFYNFPGHTDVKELALYAEDQITKGNWLFNVGMRGDLYNGLSTATQAEPRVGGSYSVKRTNTVLRMSYARTLETPFNENLVLSSRGCLNAVVSPLLSCQAANSGALSPGYRNEFHAGFQQVAGSHFVVSGEYIWKYTHNAFDFSVLGNTPITFPIDWHNSKIPGYALHVEMPQLHGFTAYFVASSVAARFFPPQVAGAGATVGQTGLPFRIDHDEKFNQESHIQYTYSRGKYLKGLWGGFNWRYDTGLVAGNAPCYGTSDPNSPCLASSTTLGGQPAIGMVDALGTPLTADEEFEAGFICNGQRATPTRSLPAVCPAAQFSSSLIRIPAPNTGDNDKDPQRIAPRDLFDASVGKDNVFHADRYKVNLDLTAVNVTDKYALYNFLSTFSGTHYVTPRSLTAKVTLNF